jgi:hypothetical protein
MVSRYFIIIPIFINIVFSCAVCYGAVEGPMVDGMNNAILFLLGTIGFILISIIGTTFHFYYKAKKLD